MPTFRSTGFAACLAASDSTSAFAAEAAEDEPRAAMMAAPRLPTML